MKHLLRVLCSLLLSTAAAMAAATETAQPYLIGRGMSDVTGPLVGVQLWGFGRADQIGEGLHIRQRSRAFVIAQADEPDRRLILVTADLGSIDHHMTLDVVEALQKQFGALYNLDNVIISATHTHAGPGGYWQSRTATGLDGGLYPQHYAAITAGIIDSILKAHADLQPGNIYISSGDVADAGVNRSVVAYRENPAEERARYHADTNTRMTMLKFEDDSGAIGMLNWYALHPTAMNFHNRLVSGDHKGYASLQVEQHFGTRYDQPDDFVAAFAQSDPGDVTPNTNLDSTGPGATDVETTRIMGERQSQVALQLFAEARETLAGPIEVRRTYVNLGNYTVEDRFTGMGVQHTCPSAYGYSFAGGSSEDGGGHFLFREGMTEQQAWRDWLIKVVTGAPEWTEAVRSCQAPKPILFETGSGDPPLQSQVHSVTIARIGQLVLLAMPTEVTTMAGRRLRSTTMNALGDWARHIVLAGYANGYAGYVTTPEEYMLQQYEGGHTLHGRWSLPAYQQVASQLAGALQDSSTLAASAQYDDWRGKSIGKPLPTGAPANASAVRRPGNSLPLAQTEYRGGETASAAFWSANPTAHFPDANTTLLVELQTPSGWEVVASDSDWNTHIRWKVKDNTWLATVTWDIPTGTPSGNYRIRHFGSIAAEEGFEGESEIMQVVD